MKRALSQVSLYNRERPFLGIEPVCTGTILDVDGGRGI